MPNASNDGLPCLLNTGKCHSLHQRRLITIFAIITICQVRVFADSVGCTGLGGGGGTCILQTIASVH